MQCLNQLRHRTVVAKSVYYLPWRFGVRFVFSEQLKLSLHQLKKLQGFIFHSIFQTRFVKDWIQMVKIGVVYCWEKMV
jgi:hypothetical protein